jgi:excisionase family DNA binding protein
MDTNDHKLFVRPSEAAARLSIGRTRLFAAIRSGDLRSVTYGNSRLIPVAALEEFAQRLTKSS